MRTLPPCRSLRRDAGLVYCPVDRRLAISGTSSEPRIGDPRLR